MFIVRITPNIIHTVAKRRLLDMVPALNTVGTMPATTTTITALYHFLISKLATLSSVAGRRNIYV